MEVQLHSFLTAALDVDEWLLSSFSRGEEPTGVWVGRWGGLEFSEKNRILRANRDSKLGAS